MKTSTQLLLTSIMIIISALLFYGATELVHKSALGFVIFIVLSWHCLFLGFMFYNSK